MCSAISFGKIVVFLTLFGCGKDNISHQKGTLKGQVCVKMNKTC